MAVETGARGNHQLCCSVSAQYNAFTSTMCCTANTTSVPSKNNSKCGIKKNVSG